MPDDQQQFPQEQPPTLAPEPDDVTPDPVEGEAGPVPPADETEEVEWEGQKHRIPKALKGALLMQADYTRKTQELAEHRRAFAQEQQQASARQAANATYIKDYARLVAMDEQLAQFEQIDWAEEHGIDPHQAQSRFMQHQQLKDNRDRLARTIAEKDQQRNFETQQATARRIEENRAVLTREVPDWSPDLDKKLSEFAIRQGFPAEQLAGLAYTQPLAIKILNLAYQGEQILAKQRAQAKEPPTTANPVPTVGTRRQPPSGPRDEQSIDDWVRARNQQLAKRGVM